MYKSSENSWQSLFKVRNKFALLAGYILASSIIPTHDVLANAGGKSEIRKSKFGYPLKPGQYSKTMGYE